MLKLDVAAFGKEGEGGDGAEAFMAKTLPKDLPTGDFHSDPGAARLIRTDRGAERPRAATVDLKASERKESNLFLRASVDKGTRLAHVQGKPDTVKLLLFVNVKCKVLLQTGLERNDFVDGTNDSDIVTVKPKAAQHVITEDLARGFDSGIREGKGEEERRHHVALSDSFAAAVMLQALAGVDVDVRLFPIHPSKVIAKVLRGGAHAAKFLIDGGASGGIESVTDIERGDDNVLARVVRPLDFDNRLVRSSLVADSALRRMKVPGCFLHRKVAEDL